MNTQNTQFAPVSVPLPKYLLDFPVEIDRGDTQRFIEMFELVWRSLPQDALETLSTNWTVLPGIETGAARTKLPWVRLVEGLTNYKGVRVTSFVAGGWRLYFDSDHLRTLNDAAYQFEIAKQLARCVHCYDGSLPTEVFDMYIDDAVDWNSVDEMILATVTHWGFARAH